MKKILIAAIAASFICYPFFAGAAFVEFNPKTAQFISPNQNQRLKSAAVPTPKVLGTTTVSDAYIKNMVTATVNQMMVQGLLKGEKGDKGDSAPMTANPDPNAVGLQPVYIPGAAVGPDVGTIFGASSLSAQNLSASAATLGDTEVDGGLTVSGDADLQGNISVATATISNLNIGSLTSDSGAYLSDGGDWVNASSRTLKENLVAVDSQSILDKLDALPLYTWNYKSQNPSVTHLGPMAEDFYATFALGATNTSISTIDPAGVALAGVQALNNRLKSFAKKVVTENLEVGSSDKPTGITIYDRGTGQPVCLYFENGVIKSDGGKCESDQHPSSDQNPVQQNSEQSPGVNQQPEDAPIVDTASAPASTPATTTDQSLLNN